MRKRTEMQKKRDEDFRDVLRVFFNRDNPAFLRERARARAGAEMMRRFTKGQQR